MSNINAGQRVRALVGIAAGAVVLVLCPSATAGQYTIVSCDSAAAFGYNTAAWVPFRNAGAAYEACPTIGSPTAGVSDRLTQGTYGGFSHSGHAFTAPPGATISRFTWAGRMSRAGCRWGVYIRALPSDTPILGMPHGQYCDALGIDNRGFPLPELVPAGTTRLEQLVFCGAAECQSPAVLHTHEIAVVVDDPVPPSISLSGPLASGQWVSGTAGGAPEMRVTGSDNAGIQRLDASLAGRNGSQSSTCNWSVPRPCHEQETMAWAPGVGDLADGHHVLFVSATDAAGNVGTARQDIYVDNNPPDPVLPDIAGGTAWRRTNGFAVSWINPPANASPIIRAHWKLCRPDGSCPSRGTRDGDGIHALPQILAPAAGEYRLSVWLEDAAGNRREANAATAVPVRFDPEPPELAFVAPDPADPLRVAVNASDRHSGLATGEIEMRETGTATWHGLPTTVAGSQLVTYVDDERFRRGAYEFRARAQDQAGNEASTGRRTDGSAAMLRLPARVDTRLVVGVPRKVRGNSRRRRLDSTVTAGFGSVLRLSGFLSNSDGQPLEAASIEALEEQSDGTSLLNGLATTRSDGRFRYVLRATRNRQLLFRYPGSRRIGAAAAVFKLRVPAATSIRVNRKTVRNGQAVVFRGRVRSRPLPQNGKLIEMQAHFRGRWRTFSTLRTDRRGGWTFPYRFGATLGRVTYRFRARLPSEGGYPFVTGRSRVAKVVVVGP